MDETLFLPVAAGYWKQHELWDGTYTLNDLLDILEVIQVKNENDRRAGEKTKSKPPAKPVVCTTPSRR